MNSKIILQNIANHISLTPEEENYFLSVLSHKKIKPKQFIIKEGQISKHLTFINQGCCKVFNTDINGFEHILLFAFQDFWVGDLCGLISQAPSRLNIQALTEMEVLQITKTDLDALYIKIPKFERLFRILTEKAYIEMQNRVLNGLGLSSKERYIIFQKKYAEILDILPQKQIALYLGVTPEFFSRMKKKL